MTPNKMNKTALQTMSIEAESVKIILASVMNKKISPIRFHVLSLVA